MHRTFVWKKIGIGLPPGGIFRYHERQPNGNTRRQIALLFERKKNSYSIPRDRPVPQRVGERNWPLAFGEMDAKKRDWAKRGWQKRTSEIGEKYGCFAMANFHGVHQNGNFRSSRYFLHGNKLPANPSLLISLLGFWCPRGILGQPDLLFGPDPDRRHQFLTSPSHRLRHFDFPLRYSTRRDSRAPDLFVENDQKGGHRGTLL